MRVMYYGRIYIIAMSQPAPIPIAAFFAGRTQASLAPIRIQVMGALRSLFNGAARFDLVATNGEYGFNAQFEVALHHLAEPDAYEEVLPEDLPQYLDWPYKTEIFDRLLKGEPA